MRAETPVVKGFADARPARVHLEIKANQPARFDILTVHTWPQFAET